MVSSKQEIQVPGHGQVEIPTGLFIDNEFHPSSDQGAFSTVNPATGEHLAEYYHATSEDVDRAVRSSRRAFKHSWGSAIPATERAALLYRLADLMQRDLELLASLESLDAGKGVRVARVVDVGGAIDTIRYYAGMADKYYGQTIDHFGTQKFVYSLYKPIGVCGQIVPWNYPLSTWAWKVAPALAVGCCVIMKPSELTPMTALYACKLVKEAGFPPGVLNTLPGLGASTGDAIARHMDIDKVSFTGSTMTGRKISVAAAESNLKKVTLELGGKSPVLVFASADIEEAAKWVALGIFNNAGQNCCAASRVYVEKSVYEPFLQALKAKAEDVAIGLPSDEATSFGPLISGNQRDKVLSYIQSGVNDGAKIVTGGGKWSHSGGGFWVEPTILAETTVSMSVVREEIFGPVIVASEFVDETEALRVANDTIYGLAAAVFTNDATQATRIAHNLEAGTVWINQYSYLHHGSPFGGFKQSGVGRELGTAGLHSYMESIKIFQWACEAVALLRPREDC